jgi:hypothetical protein
MSNDRRLLELALKGLEVEKQRIEQEIAAVKRRLGMEPAIRTPREKKSVKRSHRLTDAGRKRLSDIMKARWASGHPPIKFKKKKAA